MAVSSRHLGDKNKLVCLEQKVPDKRNHLLKLNQNDLALSWLTRTATMTLCNNSRGETFFLKIAFERCNIFFWKLEAWSKDEEGNIKQVLKHQDLKDKLTALILSRQMPAYRDVLRRKLRRETIWRCQVPNHKP